MALGLNEVEEKSIQSDVKNSKYVRFLVDKICGTLDAADIC